MVSKQTFILSSAPGLIRLSFRRYGLAGSTDYFSGDAGHDYGTIETKGYRKLIEEKTQKAC